MRYCVSCLCVTDRYQRKCWGCTLHPPPYFWKERNEEDFEPCNMCDLPICGLHASQDQLRRQLCAGCYDTRMSSSDSDSDSFEQDQEGGRTHAYGWDSDDLQEDHAHAHDEWSDAGDAEQEVVQPVRHTLVSAPGSTQDKCTICLDAMDDETRVVQLPCTGKHMYHTQCIETWLSRKQHCPLCNTLVHVCIQ